MYNPHNRTYFIPQSLSWYHRRFAPATALLQTLATVDSIAGHLSARCQAPCQAFHLLPQTSSMAPCSLVADPIAGHLSPLRSSPVADSFMGPLVVAIRSPATLAVAICSPALCPSARSCSICRLLQRSVQSLPVPPRSATPAPACCRRHVDPIGLPSRMRDPRPSHEHF
jgi:hypothetical protein